VITNSGHVGNLRGQWRDEVKEEVPLNQEACGVADVSYMENGVHVSCLDLFSHCLGHRNRSRLQRRPMTIRTRPSSYFPRLTTTIACHTRMYSLRRKDPALEQFASTLYFDLPYPLY